jgi:hypothetical protein
MGWPNKRSLTFRGFRATRRSIRAYAFATSQQGCTLGVVTNLLTGWRTRAVGVFVSLGWNVSSTQGLVSQSTVPLTIPSARYDPYGTRTRRSDLRVSRSPASLCSWSQLSAHLQMHAARRLFAYDNNSTGQTCGVHSFMSCTCRCTVIQHAVHTRCIQVKYGVGCSHAQLCNAVIFYSRRCAPPATTAPSG